MPWIFVAIVLVFIFARNGRYSRRWQRRWDAGASDYLAELQAMNEEQRLQIEALEGRVARLEEGLEFAERLLAATPRAVPSPAAAEPAPAGFAG